MQVVPPELWIQIIGKLPSHYQRSCLSVSKLFHDISLQYVFATINLRLGLLKDHYLANEERWRPLEDEDREEAAAAIHRSCELLRHIVSLPRSRLVQAVRNVSVRAYTHEEESPPEELLNALEDALSVLRLRGFAWYGCHPMPRQPVFEALFTASGETLEDIVLPADLELANVPVPMYPHLKSLSYLNRYGDIYQPVDEENLHFDSMRQTITQASSSLRSLGTFSEVLWNCNLQRLPTLVELTLVLLIEIDPIGTIFTHFSQLRSLTLLVGDDHFGDLASVLCTHLDTLPLLTAFRLSYPDMTRDDAEATAAFLRKKPLLERLDIGHHWSSPFFDDIEPVLEILPELPRLRVLGWGLIGTYDSPCLTPDHLLRVSQSIPHGLTALSLWITAQEPSIATETDWIQFFRSLQSCRFVYVATDREFPDTREVQGALLDHPPPSAELVGFNEDIGWVEREPETGRVAYSECWPLSKVYYRTVEEFGCEEWEWLLKGLDLRLIQ